MKFPLGQIVVTANALSKLDMYDISIALSRHKSGDWGDLCDEDKALNDRAVQYGDRIFSAYHAKDGTKFWVITEADRSYTTVLLPEDY